jgi:hypothetical protein
VEKVIGLNLRRFFREVLGALDVSRGVGPGTAPAPR